MSLTTPRMSHEDGKLDRTGGPNLLDGTPGTGRGTDGGTLESSQVTSAIRTGTREPSAFASSKSIKKIRADSPATKQNDALVDLPPGRLVLKSSFDLTYRRSPVCQSPLQPASPHSPPRQPRNCDPSTTLPSRYSNICSCPFGPRA